MDTQYNVLCLKWGTKYSAEYVNKLHSMVERHLSLPHRFVCLTEDETNINPQVECLPLLSDNLTGWWNKLSIFQEEVHDLKGPTVFLDLDVVITGNIDFLFTEQEDETFRGVEDFIWPNREFNTSVFRFNIGSHPSVYRRFTRELTLRSDGNYYNRGNTAFVGDQPWITHCIFPNGGHTKHAYQPGQIVSYKRRVMHGGLSPEIKIVVFHGEPNPDQVDDRWIHEHWY